MKAEQQRRFSTNRLKFYTPNLKQIEHHGAGAKHSERLLMAGNQLGKTLAGGAEWAYHLTQRYPTWWQGAVFQKPVKLWASSVSNESTRKTVQTMLVGPPEKAHEWGTGMIPKEALVDYDRAQGVPNLLDNVIVKHGGGGDLQAGESIVHFMSYEKGRTKWQGPTVDGVWFDEEPPEDVYTEGVTRTINGQLGTFVQVTFTPLMGMTRVVLSYLTPKQIEKLMKG